MEMRGNYSRLNIKIYNQQKNDHLHSITINEIWISLYSDQKRIKSWTGQDKMKREGF